MNPYSMSIVGRGVAAIVFWTGDRFEVVRPYLMRVGEERRAREDTARLNASYASEDRKAHYNTALTVTENRRRWRYSLRWWKAEHEYWVAKLDTLKDVEVNYDAAV